MDNPNIVYKITNLSFSHDKEKEQLRGLNLDIHAGEKIAVLGPNGCGKSTLLNLLSGYIEPNEGEIFLKGENLSTLSPLERAKVLTYLSQSGPSINLDLSLFDFVEMGLFSEQGRFDNTSKEQRERIEMAIALFDLSALKTRAVTTLSGGEFQRARLARSFLRKPKIVLLDEPSAALDIKYQLKLWEHLGSLQSHTVIAALHNIDTASRVFNRCLLFNAQGELVADTEELNAKDLENAFQVKVKFIDFQEGGHWFFKP